MIIFFFLQMLVDLCIAANFHRADPRITIRRQRPTWFGNIRYFKDEMHLKILKKLCMHKITINQYEFVIFASQGVSRSTTINHMLWGAE